MSRRDRLSGNEAIATAMRQIEPDVFFNNGRAEAVEQFLEVVLVALYPVF